jgi:hypothetical protein
MNYGIITDPSNVVAAAIQSSDPTDLQNRINTYLASLDPQTTLLASITLAGGGDGHTFVALIETGPSADINGGLAVGATAGVQPTQVRCYLGSTGEDLAIAKAAAGFPAPVLGLGFLGLDEQVAGASKGTRFMGMTVFGFAAIPTILVPVVRAQRTMTPQAIAGAGSVLVAFDDLIPTAGNFSLPVPTVVQYDGKASIETLLDLSIVVSLNAPGDVIVELLTDPTGTPNVLALMHGTVPVANNSTNVSIPFSYFFVPPPLGSATQRRIGVRVTTPGAGTIDQCFLRIAPR